MKNKTIRIVTTTCLFASLLSVSPVNAIQPDSTQTVDFSQDEEKYSRLCTAVSWDLEKNNTCKEYKKYLEDKINQSESSIDDKQSTLIQIDSSINTVTANYDNKKTDYEENVSYLNTLKETHEMTQSKISEKKEELSASSLEQSRVVTSSHTSNISTNSEKTEKNLTALHTTDSEHKEAKKNLDSLESMSTLEQNTITTQENIVQYKKEDVELANSFVQKAKESYSTLNDEIKTEMNSVNDAKKTLQKIESVSQKQQVALISYLNIETPTQTQPVPRSKSHDDLIMMKQVVTEKKRIEEEKQQYEQYKAEEERKAREEAARQEAERKRQAEEARKQVGQNIVNAAMTKIGSPYVWGASGPNTFDCSGLVYWAHKQAGVYFTRTTAAELNHMGKEVSFSELQPGDIITLNTLGYVSHVVIYVGNGKIIHAPQTGDVVKVVSFPERWRNKIVSCRRLY